MNQNLPDDLQYRILALLDGTLEAGEAAHLDEELRGNKEARALFLQLATLHSALEDEGASKSGMQNVPVVPIELFLARERRRLIRNSLMAAAAVLLISGLVLWMKIIPDTTPPLADFRAAPNSIFQLSHTGNDERPVGNALTTGSRVVLEHGVVELELPHDVRAVIEAPADITLVDERTLQLIHGQGYFQVPSKEGRGFTVVTPHQRIVDLGTAFGIRAPANQDKVELHVIEGRVRVDSLDGSEGDTIKENRSVLLAGAQVERDIDQSTSTFRRKLPTKVETILLEDFESGLLGGRDYSVQMDPTVIRDLAGNRFRGINDDTTWNFTTASLSTALVATDMNVGGLDTGFDGGFYEGSKHIFITNAPDLVYPNYGIVQTGTTEKVYAVNAVPDRQDLRDLATAMTGEIWFSVLVNVPDGASYAGLTFNSRGETYDPVATAARILMTPNQLQVGFKGDAAAPGKGTYAAGKTHLLLGHMKVVSGNDTLSVWVDPDLTGVNSPDALPAASFTSTTVDFADSITQLGVAGCRGNGESDAMLDAIRLSNHATAFSDVTGVRIVATEVVAKAEPSIVRIKSIKGNKNVTSDGKLVLTFSEPIQRGSGDVVIRKISNGDIVETIPVTSAQLAIRHSELTVRPVSRLGSDCSVEITAGAVESLTGISFPGITADAARSFLRKMPDTSTPSTSAEDDTPPVLVALSPADDIFRVKPGSLLEMTFDEPVKLGTGRIFVRNATDWEESEIVVGDPKISVEGNTVTINPKVKLPDGTISMKWVGNWGADAAVGLLNPKGDGRWYSDNDLRDRGQGKIGSMRGPLMATFRQPQPHTRIQHELSPIAAGSSYTVSAAIGVRDADAKENAAFLGYTIRLKSRGTVLAELSDGTPPGPPNSVTNVGFSWHSATMPEGVSPGDPLAIEIAPRQHSTPSPGYLDIDNVRVTVIAE
jgi:ferric-dicitrate binding protein FerR (iron transport regulator)